MKLKKLDDDTSFMSVDEVVNKLEALSNFIFFLANPELPICNRRKRDVKVDRDSLLDIRPNLRISLISNGPFRGEKDSVDLTWGDVIFPTRVGFHSNFLNYTHKYFSLYSLDLVFFSILLI